MTTAFLSILLVGLLGGAIPLVRRWSDRWHHAALAFSAGVFLGAVFLHLLPSVAAGGAGHAGHDHAAHVGEGPAGEDAHDHAGHDHDGHEHGPQEEWNERLRANGLAPDPDSTGPGHASDDHEGRDRERAGHGAHAGHAHGPIGPWLWVLAGLLGVFLIEALLIPGSTHGHGHAHDQERHTAVGYAALLGLTVHALTAGVALAAMQGEERLAGVMLVAILAHKGFESFSLASVFGLAGMARTKIVALIVAFSLVTPLGLLLGDSIVAGVGESGVGVATALATGTFLYVSLCELLPEVFHRRQDGPLKIVLLGLGVAAMWWAHQAGGV
ncbi:MAG: ZIP family metal transporter [Planctomycetota bacterium]